MKFVENQSENHLTWQRRAGRAELERSYKRKKI